jgi:hypothetical protein
MNLTRDGGNRWKRIIIACCAVAGVVVLALAFVDVAPEGSKTIGRMERLRRAIVEHAARTGNIPASLNELQVSPDDRADEWRRPFTYLVDKGAVTLRSYGRDGAPGGDHADADITGVFMLRKTDQGWRDPDPLRWNVRPRGER